MSCRPLFLALLRFVLLLRFAKDLEPMVSGETGEGEFLKLKEIAKTASKINSKTLKSYLVFALMMRIRYNARPMAVFHPIEQQ